MKTPQWSMGTLGPYEEGLVPLGFPAVASHLLTHLLLCPLLRPCLLHGLHTQLWAAAPPWSPGEAERGEWKGPWPLPARLGLFLWPPLLGCVLKRIFILQNVLIITSSELLFFSLFALVLSKLFPSSALGVQGDWVSLRSPVGLGLPQGHPTAVPRRPSAGLLPHHLIHFLLAWFHL